MFCFKGTVSQDFLLQVFFMNHLPPKPLKIRHFVDLPYFFIFLLTSTYLKCSNSNFYQIKKSAKQTCSWLLDSFAIKGGNFFKKMFNSLLYGGKFADLQPGLAHQLNLGICNLRIRISQKFADLWLQIKPKNSQNLKNSCLATFANLLRGLGETDIWKKPEVIEAS